MSHRVLVVEDERDLANLLAMNLRHEGFEVRTAYDGREGLAHVKSWVPDLVILDLMLPVMNGFDVLRHLSVADPAMLERTIVITGASERLYRNSPQIRHTRALLRKPFDIAKLQQEVAAACAVHH